MRDECGLGGSHLIPLDPCEPRVRLDFVRAIGSKPTARVKGQQTLHEVACFRCIINIIFQPIHVPREDVLEHLLWRLIVEWRRTIEEFVCDDTKCPLRKKKKSRKMTVTSTETTDGKQVQVTVTKTKTKKTKKTGKKVTVAETGLPGKLKINFLD